jgi:hypothetical protein
MAIEWYPANKENPFTFGGDIVVDGTTEDKLGIPGPQPRYSMSREIIKKDTMFLRNKYNITITGIGLINQEASMLVAGERQAQIHDIIRRLGHYSGKPGRLEITPYGGLAQIIKFRTAVLLSAEIEEQDDTSQGVQNQNYTLTFEAYDMLLFQDGADPLEVDKQYAAQDTVIGGTPAAPIYFNIKDFSESWDWNVTEEYDFQDVEMWPGSGETADPTEQAKRNIDRTFLISHTVSATGFSAPDFEGTEAGSVDAQTDSAYIQARNFVTYWLQSIRQGANYTPPTTTNSVEPPGDEPAEETNAIYNDPFGDRVLDHSSKTENYLFGENGGQKKIQLQGAQIDPDAAARGYFAGIYNELVDGDPTIPQHRAWDQTNTYTQDILEGTYSVTRTWKVSKFPSIANVSFDLNEDVTSEANVISVTIDIQGRETFSNPARTDSVGTPVSTGTNITERNVVDKTSSDKYRNAKERARFFLGENLGNLVDKFYDVMFPRAERPLNGGNVNGIKKVPTSLSQTHNQTDGSISISATYSDVQLPDPSVWGDIVDETVTITDTNSDGLNEIVAILPVIAKRSGPIIQNMRTTPERTRSVSLEWKMNVNTPVVEGVGFPENRVRKPYGLQYIQQYYRPLPAQEWSMPEGQEGTTPPVYRQNATETWNWRTGIYQATVDYVWTDGTTDHDDRRVPSIPVTDTNAGPFSPTDRADPLSSPPDAAINNPFPT